MTRASAPSQRAKRLTMIGEDLEGQIGGSHGRRAQQAATQPENVSPHRPTYLDGWGSARTTVHRHPGTQPACLALVRDA